MIDTPQPGYSGPQGKSYQEVIKNNDGPKNLDPIKLDNSTSILVMGILGIVLSMGLIGIVLNIIVLSMAPAAIREYEENPGWYTESSLKNVKAGRVCSIVGLSLAGFALVLLLAFFGITSL